MRYINGIKKNGALMMFGGAAYGIIEILWRGKTHWSMVITGGFCFTVLNGIYKRFTKLFLVGKCLIGSAVITACEYVCGMIVNVKLGLNVWDYSHNKFNIKGQICPFYSVMWMLLCLPICFISKILNRKKLPEKTSEQI